MNEWNSMIGDDYRICQYYYLIQVKSREWETYASLFPSLVFFSSRFSLYFIIFEKFRKRVTVPPTSFSSLSLPRLWISEFTLCSSSFEILLSPPLTWLSLIGSHSWRGWWVTQPPLTLLNILDTKHYHLTLPSTHTKSKPITSLSSLPSFRTLW